MLALAQKIDVKGFAHITGGGLTDNIPRVLPDGFEVVAAAAQLGARPGVRLAGRHGHASRRAEMYRTFNCGIGMIVVVAPADVDAALAALRAARRDRRRHRRRRARHARRRHRGMTAMLPVAVVISGRGSNMEAIARASLPAGSRLRGS